MGAHSLDPVVDALPCAKEDHYPMGVKVEESRSGSAVHGFVRTDSFHWDGCGGRTDLHDVLSATWAAVLRANGVASSRLVDAEGWSGAPELYARLLLFEQPFESVVSPSVAPETARRLKAYTAWASHQIRDAVGLDNPSARQPAWHDEVPPPWVANVRRSSQ